MSKDIKIHRTRDYKIFRVIVSNRDIDGRHVNKLAESIRKKNLLFIRPVIVNERLEVIDGQHRISACEKLGEEVCYVIAQGLTREDITVLNTAQKNWTMMDFINFYTIEGRKEYREFSKLINQYPEMKVTTLLNLCSPGFARNVRNGELNISNIVRARTVCNWVRHLRNVSYSFVIERDFGLALNNVVETEQQFSKLFNRANHENFIKCNSKPEYERLLKRLIA